MHNFFFNFFSPIFSLQKIVLKNLSGNVWGEDEPQTNKTNESIQTKIKVKPDHSTKKQEWTLYSDNK